MKLLTHNLLRSNVKGVQNGFPLRIEVLEKENVHVEFNPAFITKMLNRLDWIALRQAAKDVLPDVILPEILTTDLLSNTEFLQLVHSVLLEVDILEGFLICPESGRKFKISKGIPNMLLRADEL
jgi:multifunctional methyltransferase subunit TRM112